MSEENIDNNSDKHFLPDTVIVKRIANQCYPSTWDFAKMQ